MRVLVVEDEKRLAASLKRGLEADSFVVDVALDGTDGLWMAQENDYDAIVLDIMLPGVNGFRICSTLRDAGDWTPILMLTAKDGELDETEALDTGADDYLTKPFSHLVLVAHLRALMRRGARERPAVLAAGDTTVRCTIPHLPLPRGRFYVWIGIVDESGEDLVAWHPAANIDVIGAFLDPAPRAVVRLSPIHVPAVWDVDA